MPPPPPYPWLLNYCTPIFSLYTAQYIYMILLNISSHYTIRIVIIYQYYMTGPHYNTHFRFLVQFVFQCTLLPFLLWTKCLTEQMRVHGKVGSTLTTNSTTQLIHTFSFFPKNTPAIIYRFAWRALNGVNCGHVMSLLYRHWYEAEALDVR